MLFLLRAFRLRTSEAFFRYFVRLGELWSGSPLVDLVYRMAYPLVRVDSTLTRGKALL